MKRVVTCEMVFDMSVFHFTLCDTRRGTSTAWTTWDGCAARVPVRHVALHVVIPLKIASESDWIVVVDDHEPGEEGRTDGQAWSRHSHSAGTRVREDSMQTQENRGDNTTASTNTC